MPRQTPTKFLDMARRMRSHMMDIDAEHELFPETAAALQALERAVAAEWGIVAQAHAQLPARSGARRKLKRMRQREWCQKRRRALAE